LNGVAATNVAISLNFKIYPKITRTTKNKVHWQFLKRKFHSQHFCQINVYNAEMHSYLEKIVAIRCSARF